MTYLKVMKICKSDTTVITSLFKQNAHESSIHNQQQKYDINQKMENGKKKIKLQREKRPHLWYLPPLLFVSKRRLITKDCV